MNNFENSTETPTFVNMSSCLIRTHYEVYEPICRRFFLLFTGNASLRNRNIHSPRPPPQIFPPQCICAWIENGIKNELFYSFFQEGKRVESEGEWKIKYGGQGANFCQGNMGFWCLYKFNFFFFNSWNFYSHRRKFLNNIMKKFYKFPDLIWYKKKKRRGGDRGERGGFSDPERPSIIWLDFV